MDGQSRCPVCDKKYSAVEIEGHVELCLNQAEMLMMEDKHQPKRSKLDWGCLTPHQSRNKHFNSKRAGSSSNSGSSRGKKLPYPDSVRYENEEDRDEMDSNEDTVKAKKNSSAVYPLAEEMRPCSLEEYVGQDDLLGESSVFRGLIENHKIPNMILWGPPGCGKTSLVHIIAKLCKAHKFARFVNFSAATCGVGDVKEVIKIAQNDRNMFKKNTILFMDEIHRFNKLQQDTFLPHVENGTITLVGATTENPSFSLNSALLSRCKVFVLGKLEIPAIEKILLRALSKLNISCIDPETETESQDDTSDKICIEKKALEALTHYSDGDARIALNGLQIVAQYAQLSKENGLKKITENNIKDALLRTHTLYDRTGDEHYNCISALHKSIRGSDVNASLYWLARMLISGEDPLYVARRLIRCASEDIGLADPQALQQSVCAYQACQFIGMPECKVILAQCVVYLAKCPKSIEVYKAYSKAEECIKTHQGPLPGVPLHLRNAPTKLMKDLDYGKDYKYNPLFDEPVDQEYMPKELLGMDFFK